MMSTIAWLLFAHLLADYPLQGEFLANFKGKNPIVLVSHAGIWTGCITLGLVLLGYHPTAAVVISLFVVHAFFDWLKASKQLWYENMNALTWGLLIDQLLHVLQIIFAVLMCGGTL